MLNRRQLLYRGSAAAVLGGISKVGVASPTLQTDGCSLTADVAAALMRSIDPDTITPSSGDRQLDYAIAQTLSHLTDEFHVLPSFVFYQEAYQFNAFAMPVIRVPNTDGTVLFGRTLLKICLSYREAPDAAVACTCAHEFGHIVQYKRGLQPVLKHENETARRIELHADFLAGYFAGIRKQKRNDFPAAVFATTQYNVGDDNFFSPTHHGTSDERAAAIVRGYEAAYKERLSLDDAIQVGITYVSRA